MSDKDDDKDKKQVLLPTSQPQCCHCCAHYQRGCFERSFVKIGTCCMVGAKIGIIRGVQNGLEIILAEKQTRIYNRTQLFNSVLKHGSGTSNKFGTLAIYHSVFGIILEKSGVSQGEIFNNIVAGTSTGLLYSSTSGLRRCGIGGLLGFSLTMIYSLISSRDAIIKYIKKPFIHSKNQQQ